VVVSDSKTLADFLDVVDTLQDEDRKAVLTFVKDILLGSVFTEIRNEKLTRELNNALEKQNNENEDSSVLSILEEEDES